MPPELDYDDFDLRDPDRQPHGWALIDPRARMFTCPVCWCGVPDQWRLAHREWHEKIA